MPKLPSAIKDTISVRKQPNFSSSTCNGCTGKCCSGPGFALLENVQQIFEIYSKGLLKRDDFEFKKGLDFCAFIQEYFDRVYFNNTLLTFFPKTLSENDRLMHIPPWSYYQAREYIQARNTNYGCIFLNKKRNSNNGLGHKCILHSDNTEEEITAKPLDCVFLACTSAMQIVTPKSTDSAYWLAALDYHFPDSVSRFRTLCPSLANTV